jgi:hypothetical protein
MEKRQRSVADAPEADDRKPARPTARPGPSRAIYTILRVDDM